MLRATGRRRLYRHRTRIDLWCLLLAAVIVYECDALEDVVCGGFVAINSPLDFVQTIGDRMTKWENCTVIEGNVRIKLMMPNGGLTKNDYKLIALPNVREITGYLMIFEAGGLDSIATLLPNLRIIRGNNLFITYALVVFQNADMTEVGLTKLIEISRGGVRISSNAQLCYASTVNWTKIVRDETADIVIQENQNPNSCADRCHQENNHTCSLRTTKDGHSVFNCWNDKSCQQICPETCTSRNLTCNLDGGYCCDDECLGGCVGPSDKECNACRHVNVKGQCLKKCPAGLYTLKGRRCVTGDACERLPPAFDRQKHTVAYKAFDIGICGTDCPEGYNVHPNNTRECVPCTSNYDCVKVCKGEQITSLAQAEAFKGCTLVVGHLEIIIQSVPATRNVAQELEEYLGEIREVTGYLKVALTPSLVALSMFKNLRLVRGQNSKINGNYSLSVLENPNLAQLWNFSSELVINGSIQFHNNPLLCYSKIVDLAKLIGINELNPYDVSSFSNGNKAVCSVRELIITKIKNVDPTLMTISWLPFNTDGMDHRMFLGYRVYSRQVETDDVDISEGRDACHDSWEMTFAGPLEHGVIVGGLKPNTRYAFYVATLTVNTGGPSGGSFGGISKVIFQNTSFSVPSQPIITKIESVTPTSITMEWQPPLEPNGEITHYVISYVRKRDALPAARNYCRDKPIFAHDVDGARPLSDYRAIFNGRRSKTPKGCEHCCQRGSAYLNYTNFLRETTAMHIEKAGFENAIHDEMDLDLPSRKKRSIPVNLNVTDDTLPATVTINVTGLTFLIEGLHHFSPYEIRLIACQNTSAPEHNCSPEIIRTQRTQFIEEKDTVNGSSFRIANASEPGAVLLQWDQPDNANGLILGYDVQYGKEGSLSAPTNQCIPISSYLKHNGYVFPDLAAGRYYVRVRCMSLAQWGAWSTDFILTISEPYRFASWAIALIALFSVLALVSAIGLLAVYFYKRHLRIKLPEYLINVISANPEYISQLQVYNQDEWELKRESIELRHEIGRGTFGTVYAGVGKNVCSHNGVMFGECAVKTVSERASIYDRWHFLIEASVMKTFNVNYIVKLFGVVSEGQPALVIMEMMHSGNLKDYLRSRRPNSEENVHGLTPPTLKETLQWAGEIADGMAYLEAQKFCHRDLAARNILVSCEHICKIGDFGMARDVYVKDYYRPTGKRLMPVRWMAPEALKDAMFTSKSDVWSYGVVLWEIATLASQPYAGLSTENVISYVVDHRGTMDMPTGCPSKLYNLMKLCWKFERRDRPSFADIVSLLLPDMNDHFLNVSYCCSQRAKELFRSGSHAASDRKRLSTEPSSLTATYFDDVDDLPISVSDEKEPLCQSHNQRHASEANDRTKSSGRDVANDSNIKPPITMNDMDAGQRLLENHCITNSSL